MVEQNRSGTYSEILYSPIGKLALMNRQVTQNIFLPLPGGEQATYTGSTLRFRHSDWLGTYRFETNSSEQEYGDVAYAPFGEYYAETNTPYFGFTGQNQDTVTGQTGLYDFLHREYNPTQGRWISPDPAGTTAIDPTNPQSFNRYAYVLNDPLSYIDPLGLADCVWNNSVHDCPDGSADREYGCTIDGVASDCHSALLSRLSGATQVRVFACFGDCGFYKLDVTEGPYWAVLVASNIKSLVLRTLRSNSACAAAYGGQQSAENLLNKMTIYQVPSPYSGPFQGSYDAVTRNNNGATPGWKDSANTSNYINPNGTWNGSQYGTFVGNKFNAATVGQQETMLLHEMAHPYWAPNAHAVDSLNGMYSPYGGSLGGVPAICGTAPLPVMSN
jgi:RHS repeat-associated protein